MPLDAVLRTLLTSPGPSGCERGLRVVGHVPASVHLDARIEALRQTAQAQSAAQA